MIRDQFALEIDGIYCPVVECVDAATSPSKTVGLRADFGEATFTDTVRTKSTTVEVAFTTRARVNFLLREVEVEREEDNEYDADANHAPVQGKEGFSWCEIRVMRNANHKVNGVGRSSKTNTP